ncbi:MAG: helix-turn-helix domain-containing protein, partial [Gemmatimonadales bacterium]
TIRTRRVELAVVDPLLTGSARGHEIERLRMLFPSLPLIVYTSLTTEAAAILLRLGRQGINQAVFARYDDHPERLRQMLGEEHARTVSQCLLAQLADALAPLPAELRWALEAAFSEPDQVQTVAQFANRARLDRRTCERWFSRLGLGSPRIVLAAARILYAHRLVQDPGSTVEDVAMKLGYYRVRTLQEHARHFLGCTAGEMRLTLSPEEAVERVVRCLTVPARDAGARAS